MSSAATDSPFSFRLFRSQLKTLLEDAVAHGGWLLPALVLAATTLLFVLVRGDELRIASLDTEQQTQQTIARLQRHLDSHVQLLRSSAAMLMLDRIVQRQQWDAYLQQMEHLGLPAGLQQLGYAQHVADSDKVALISAMRADGRADYRIYPLRTSESATPVLHAAPENVHPFTRAGHDLMADAILAPFLQRATETATATLARLPDRAGMAHQLLLLLPVFPGNMVPDGLQQRRKALVGFVFSVIQVDAAFMGLDARPASASATPISLRLFDQQATGPDTLLYQDSGPHFTGRQTLRPVALNGQVWTLETGSPSVPATASTSIVIVGLLLSGWLCWLTRQGSRRREAARQRTCAEAQHTRLAKLHLAALTALSRQAIIGIDRQQRITVFNAAAGRLFGTGDENLLGAPLRELLPHRLKGARPTSPLALHAEQVAVFRLQGQGGRQARRRNGSHFDFEATIFITAGYRQRCYTILLNEVPSGDTSGDIRDDWQKRLVREMHDDFGQLLTAMKMDLGLLREQLTDPLGARIPTALQHLDRIDIVVDALIGSVRRILADQSPGVVNEDGLFNALALLVDGHAKRYRIACHLDLPAHPPSLDATLANQLYRIVQEALNNIAKHAAASAITIAIDTPPGQLLLTITDNGCGFVPQQQSGPDAYGLSGMQERVDALGGILQIETAIDHGTMIRIGLPLASQAGA